MSGPYVEMFDPEGRAGIPEIRKRVAQRLLFSDEGPTNAELEIIEDPYDRAYAREEVAAQVVPPLNT